MENESTLAEEILQGKFERLWKLSLSNKNKDIIKKDIAVSASKEQGSKLVVNAINKLNFNKVPYKLASIGMPIVDGGLIFLFVTT